MLRSLRSALARFAVRRAAACQREAPKRADLWLRLGCALTPAFADTYPALVQLRRAIEDRWGAVAAAQEAAQRFPENPDAWMLLGEAWQMTFRQQDALVAYEQVLALEERPRRCSRRATCAPPTRRCICGPRRCPTGWRACPRRAPSCSRRSVAAKAFRYGGTTTRRTRAE